MRGLLHGRRVVGVYWIRTQNDPFLHTLAPCKTGIEPTSLFGFFSWVLFADEYTYLRAYIFILDFRRLNSEAQCRHQNMRRFLPRLSSHPLRSRCRLSADLRARASGSTREGHRCMAVHAGQSESVWAESIMFYLYRPIRPDHCLYLCRIDC